MSINNAIRMTMFWLCVVCGSAAFGQSDPFVWIEGEDADESTMRSHGWYDSVKTEQLSGGAWLSHFAPGDVPEATYRVDVPTAGSYHFWVRANTVADARLAYRWGDGDWTKLATDGAVENLNIASDGAPDMRFISWVYAGEVELPSGPQTLGIRFLSPNQHHGAIDCMVLTRSPFLPRGSLRPGERTGKANPGYFAWEPPMDPFTDEALLDLRRLNEDVAGEAGRVRADGEDFVLGSGETVRFWGVNVGPGIYRMDHASHAYLAKHLAKHGVNLVRLHGAIYGRRDPAVNREQLDSLHHLVSKLRDEGIYVKLSFYFPLWFALDEGHSFMVLYFDQEMQDIYFQWADAILRTENPYTGMALAEDPAVAIVEVVNEDSHFFWTFGKDNMPATRWAELKRQFGTWLQSKYGSIEQAYAAWGDVREETDDPQAGQVELYGAWAMTTEGVNSQPRRRKRLADQVEFLTHNMRTFYEEASRYFRDECGYEGLVSCSNWHTADPRTLGALERYCYTAGDVIDRHGYYDHHHEGEAASWDVRPGQSFQSESALFLDQANPLPYVETQGYPHIVSEIGWPMPNMYRAEEPFLTAVYGSLQGKDGIMHFSVGSASWDRSVTKFALNTPVTLGSYFAAALAYRRGDIAEAEPLVVDSLELAELYALKGSEVFVGAAMDQLRAAQVPSGEESTGQIDRIDPLTFYAGRVVRNFDGAPESSVVASTEGFIDRERERVRSMTGEIVLDYGDGIAAVQTPRTQGAAGFLGRRGRIAFGDVRIEMANEYGTVMVVALDDKPLAESDRILIQCMTIDQLHGWSTSERSGMSGTIRNVGAAPWGMEKIDAQVGLRWDGSAPRRVVVCDENGYPRAKLATAQVSDGYLAIEIDLAGPYTVVER